MIVEFPPDTPLTIPVVLPIVAMVGVELVHVPPPASDNVVFCPAQTTAVPEIDDGSGLIVTVALVAVAVQDNAVVAVSVYTPALPAVTPVTEVLSEVGLPIAVPPGPAHE